MPPAALVGTRLARRATVRRGVSGGTRPRCRCSAPCTRCSRGGCRSPARSQRVEQDQRPARVDPRIVERAARHVTEPVPAHGVARRLGSATPPGRRSSRRPARRSSPRTDRRARCPSRPSRSPSTGRDSGSGTVRHRRGVVLEALDVADRPHQRLEDGLAVLGHRHAHRLRALRRAQRRDFDVDGRRTSRPRGSARRCSRVGRSASARPRRATRPKRRSRRSVPRSPSRATAAADSGRRRPRPQCPPRGRP